jgi:DNA-binding CsgD family transcriptional regulator
VQGAVDPSRPATRLAGRVDELRALEAELAVPSGAATVVIEGDAGIGKSTLWRAVLARVDHRTVLTAAPTAAETSLPFAGLVDLFADIDDERLATLPDPQLRALRAALYRDPAPARGIEPLAVGLACLGVLTALAERSPVLLAVDDAQWLDPASSSAVAFALRRTGTSPVSGLFAIRSGLPVSLELEDALRSRQATRQLLGPLDLEGLDELLRLHLDRPFPLPALLQLQRASRGNPLHAVEIARAAEGTDAELAPGRPLPVPSRLAELLRSRLARLSAPTREGLAVIAEAARPSWTLLTGALGEPSAARCFEEATVANVLTGVGDRLAFTHPLLREVVTTDLSPPQRRVLHARLADLVDDPVEQGRHLAAATAGVDLQVASTVEEAARLADRRGAPDVAAALGSEALRLTGDTATDLIARRAADLANHLTRAGAYQHAHDTLDQQLRRISPGPQRVPLLLSLAAVVEVLGQGAAAAEAFFRQAIEEARSDAVASAAAKEAFAWTLAATGQAQRARDLARESVADAERSRDARAIANATATDGMVGFMLAEGPSREVFERAAALDPRLTGLSELTGEPSATFQATNHAVWSDAAELARPLLAALRAACQERADIGGLAHCDWLGAIVDLRHGEWADAFERTRSMERALQWLGDAHANWPVSLWMSALVAAHLGELDLATQRALAGIATAERSGHAFAHLQCEGVLGFLALSRGEVRTAWERLAPLPDRLDELGYREPAFQRLTPDAVEAGVAAGDLDGASALLDRFAAAAASSRNRWGEAVVFRCRGMLQAAAGERSDAVVTLSTAVERHEGLDQPFELARTLLAQGAFLRRHKQKAAAREALERSRTILEALPAPLWHRRVERELARLGGRPSSPTALTATETQVAALVAAGLTNREVAAELFLRPKTVEWNLSKVYRKLGVRSRSELAAVWSVSRTDG